MAKKVTCKICGAFIDIETGETFVEKDSNAFDIVQLKRENELLRRENEQMRQKPVEKDDWLEG